MHLISNGRMEEEKNIQTHTHTEFRSHDHYHLVSDDVCKRNFADVIKVKIS